MHTASHAYPCHCLPATGFHDALCTLQMCWVSKMRGGEGTLQLIAI